MTEVQDPNLIRVNNSWRQGRKVAINEMGTRDGFKAMNEAVFVPGLGMWISLSAIMVVGLIGGALMYYCEKVAEKNRTAH